MAHIQNLGMDFDPRLSYQYMNAIKAAVKAGIWDGPCPDWFVRQDNNTPIQTQGAKLLKFESIPSHTLDTCFRMAFDNGKEYNVRLHEQNMYGSFYSSADVYGIAKPPSCAILDIVLAKGGPEAIAESYYSAMRGQQQSGGQSNNTLSRRTKLNWCLPSLKNCDEIIHESVSWYLKGDDVIRVHRTPYFSGTEKRYTVSKLVDRVDADLGCCPFLTHC